MLLVEKNRRREHARDGGAVEGLLVGVDAVAHSVEHAAAGSEQNGGGRECQQGADRELAFGAQKRDAVNRRRDGASEGREP